MSRKRKKKKNKIILFAVEIFVLAVLLVGLFVYSKLNKVDSTGEIGKEDVNIELDSETAEVLEGYTNIALFGLDNRDTGRYDGGNSDCEHQQRYEKGEADIGLPRYVFKCQRRNL